MVYVGTDDDDFPGEVYAPPTKPPPAALIKSEPLAQVQVPEPAISLLQPAAPRCDSPAVVRPRDLPDLSPDVRPRESPSPGRVHTPQPHETPQIRSGVVPRPVLRDIFVPQPSNDIFDTPVPETQVENERRYPDRERRKPKHLDDYASYNNDVCCLSVSRFIPQTYRQAVDSRDSSHWEEAMNEEMNSLRENDVFDLVPLPPGATAVGGRWVYTLKDSASSESPVFKARYVAKGFSQVEGRDYFDTFAPTPKMTSVRSIIQIAAQYDLVVHQMDVKTAYLNAPIDCQIFVVQPQGFSTPGLVWKLKKSLYGLKQSGKNWNDHVHQFFMDSDFVRSDTDPCIYFKTDDEGFVTVILWVDDIVLSGTSLDYVEKIKQILKDRFKMKDLGPIKQFLGINFLQNEGGIEMEQSTYLRNILQKFDMLDSKPRSTPCELNPTAANPSQSYEQQSPRRYREIVGSLIYAMTCTRPDICWVVTKLSQHLDNPTESDWVMVKHVLRYIKGTLHYKLYYTKCEGDLCLAGFSDSDWGSSVEDKRSTTGYLFTLNPQGPPISWKSKKQTTVALSSCEAEYMALAASVQETLFLYMLLRSFLKQQSVNISVDNQGAMSLASKHITEQRSKHIDIRYHFIRERIASGFISLSHVPSEENVSDLMTKPCSKQKLVKFSGVLFGGGEM